MLIEELQGAARVVRGTEVGGIPKGKDAIVTGDLSACPASSGDSVCPTYPKRDSQAMYQIHGWTGRSSNGTTTPLAAAGRSRALSI